jgi:Flp pilus assembly pilin Flp
MGPAPSGVWFAAKQGGNYMLPLQVLTLLDYGRHYCARLRDRQEGQALVEYALILSLVSIAAIVILGTVGDDVVTVLTDVANALVPGSGG